MPGIGPVSKSPLLSCVNGARAVDATAAYQARPPKPQIAPPLVRGQPSVADISEAPRTSDTNAETQALWRDACVGNANAVAASVSKAPEKIDWGYRHAGGATLLMTALEQRYSRKVIDALLNGPDRLFAARDLRGRNILHYAVDYGDPALLEKLLESKPALSVYIDFPDRVVSRSSSSRGPQTPLEQAYYRYDDGLFAALTDTAVADIPPLRYAKKNADVPSTAHGETLMDMLPDGYWGVKQVPPRAVVSTHGWVSFGTEYKRQALVETAIKDKDAEPLRRLLKGMPQDFLFEKRDSLVRSVLEDGHFPSVRVVANHYQEELFSPRTDGATVLHLAAEKCNGKTIDWLFGKFEKSLNLSALDDDGRTPLLRAAHHKNREGMFSLLRRYPDEPMADVDKSGHGLLLTLLNRQPEDAAAVVERPDLLARITRVDINVTLAQTIDNLVQHTSLESAFHLNPANESANMRILRALLSLPPGSIDIGRTIVSTGKSLSDTMKSRRFIHVSALIAAHDRAHAGTAALPSAVATKPLSAIATPKKKRRLLAATKAAPRPPGVPTASAEASARRGKASKKSPGFFTGLFAKAKTHKK